MNYVTVLVTEIKAATDAALLCEIDGSEIWLPKSQIEDGDEIEVGEEDIEINVAGWLAEQEGLVG